MSGTRSDGSQEHTSDAQRSQSDIQEEIQNTIYSNYKWCFVAVVVSIPISVRMKSYWPLAILGSLGSIADYTTGYVAAFPLKQELVAVRKRDQQEAQRTGGYTPQTPRYIDFSKPSGAEAEAVHPEDEVEERLRR